MATYPNTDYLKKKREEQQAAQNAAIQRAAANNQAAQTAGTKPAYGQQQRQNQPATPGQNNGYTGAPAGSMAQKANTRAAAPETTEQYFTMDGLPMEISNGMTVPASAQNGPIRSRMNTPQYTESGQKYTDAINQLYDRMMTAEPYSSPYDSRASELYEQIMGREPYQSQWGDQIADLYSQMSGRGTYQSPYEEQIKNLYDTLINRPKFTYDPNRDPLYQQYREQYARGGQQAMRDTMGASAALTGGYGNSWGNTAGYQAYQNYMAGLNDVLPELTQQAYNRYQDEGDELRSRLSSALAMDEQGYNRWQDEGDELRNRLSSALAMDEQDYDRWRQAGDELRQNYNAAANMGAQDWQRYLQGQDLLKDQINLQSSLRAGDLSYLQALRNAEMTAAMANADAMAAAGDMMGFYDDMGNLVGGGGGGGGAGNSFDWREYTASLNGIANGQLNKNKSPLTTLGSVNAMNNWYSNMYDKMDNAGKKASTAGSSGGGSTLMDTLANAWNTVVNAAAGAAAGGSGSSGENSLDPIRKKRGL